MILKGLFAAVIIAFLVSAAFVFLLKRRGPWGGFFSMFIIILLVAWTASLWIDAEDLAVFGINWVPMISAAIIFGLLIAAAGPAAKSDEGAKNAGMALGAFYWVLVAMLVITVLLALVLRG